MFVTQCICRAISKQLTVTPHVEKLDKFTEDAHTTAHNHITPRP